MTCWSVIEIEKAHGTLLVYQSDEGKQEFEFLPSQEILCQFAITCELVEKSVKGQMEAVHEEICRSLRRSSHGNLSNV